MKFPTHKARLKSHPLTLFANPHQPSPNVNDSAPRPLFRSADNVNDFVPRPLVAARKVLWTSKTLPGDHFLRYGHCLRPRCLLCSSSPTPHCLPGTSVPPSPEPCSSSPTPHYLPGMPVPPPGALPLSRGAHSGAAGQRPTSTTTAPRPRARGPYSTMPSRDVSPPPGALPLSRVAHSGAAGQRKTSTTTARLSGATIPSRR